MSADTDPGEMPAAEPEAAALAFPLKRDSPHAADAVAAGRPVRFYLVTLLGIDAAAVVRLLPTTGEVMRADGMVPVYVTDLTDYAVFRQAGVIFEPVPPLGSSAALVPELDWHARRREVLELIRDRWKPAGTAVLGDDPAGGR